MIEVLEYRNQIGVIEIVSHDELQLVRITRIAQVWVLTGAGTVGTRQTITEAKCEIDALSEVGRFVENVGNADGFAETRRQGKRADYRIGDTAVLQLLDLASALTRGE